VAAAVAWHCRYRVWYLGFFWPGLTLLTLTLLWGAYSLSDGIFAVWAAISVRTADAASRWWFALAGVVSILAGFIAFFWPDITAMVLQLFIATWAIIIGALQIWGAIELRKEIEGEWLLALNGVLSIGFGVIMYVQPAAGALTGGTLSNRVNRSAPIPCARPAMPPHLAIPLPNVRFPG